MSTHDRRQRVEDACADLLLAGQPVTFDDVAARTGLGRATLYRNPDLRAVIEEHRTRGREAAHPHRPRNRDRPPAHRPGRPRRQRPTTRRTTYADSAGPTAPPTTDRSSREPPFYGRISRITGGQGAGRAAARLPGTLVPARPGVHRAGRLQHPDPGVPGPGEHPPPPKVGNQSSSTDERPSRLMVWRRQPRSLQLEQMGKLTVSSPAVPQKVMALDGEDAFGSCDPSSVEQARPPMASIGGLVSPLRSPWQSHPPPSPLNGSQRHTCRSEAICPSRPTTLNHAWVVRDVLRPVRLASP